MSPGLRRYAIAAAAALHLAVFLWLIDPWRDAHEPQPEVALPVTLVFEAPPKPTPQPAAPRPQPPKPPEEPPLYRESGPDTKTTAPPQPPEPEPLKAEAKPAEEPPPAPREALVVPPPAPAPAITPTPPTPPASKPEPPRPATRPREEKPPGPQRQPVAANPHAPARMKNAVPGDQVTSGDPYFNSLVAELEKHRFYPELARPLGLVGTPRFDMKIDRTGRIVGLQLQESSGTELIDRAAEKMIRDTARFPPPPSDIPGDLIIIWIELPIHPM